MRIHLPLVGALAGLGLAVTAGAKASARFGMGAAQAGDRLPGDELIPDATLQGDRGETIDAPVDAVWPWIMQIGQDRGGFYSWTAAENAIGCDVTDVRVLRPEWATREVGDLVMLAPDFGLRVAQSEPDFALVLTSTGGAVPQEQQGPAMDFDFSWAFVLMGFGGQTFLHVRERYLPRTAAARATCQAVLPVSAVMTRKMLRTIKELAESGSVAAGGVL